MLSPTDVRKRFPSLAQMQNGRPVVFFDNPGGTQVPESVIEAMSDYLRTNNANLGGPFRTSLRSGEILEETRAALGDMLGASADEIVFGPNMTTLTFGVSRCLGSVLNRGDEIIVTRLDHDANITPWVLLARDSGAAIRWWDFDPKDCTLKLPDLERLLSPRTRIVACGYASNTVGTVNDVKGVVSMAHKAGAFAFIDAVHYAPHGPIDVRDLGCDFLVCSAYKFFGPHVGVLYGKAEVLERLAAYKVRPAPDSPPRKFETGTQNHEGIAGTLAAVEYIAGLSAETGPVSRRDRILKSMHEIRAYEAALCSRLITGLRQIQGLHIHGITDPAGIYRRVPTVSFRLEGFSPSRVASFLGDRGIFVWDGNFYAPELTERIGVEDHGGLVRVGLVHYNLHEEIDRMVEDLHDLVRDNLNRIQKDTRHEDQ